VLHFDRLTTDHNVRSDIAETFEREWKSLRRPGSHFSSHEKIQVCERARRTRAGDSTEDGLADVTRRVVDTIAARPATIRKPWVEDVTANLPMPGYVESVSLVSRIAAIDAFHDVLGIARPELPDAGPGNPTGEFNPVAAPSKAYVPMTRGASIWWALTLVPEAYARMEDLHCVLYLSPEQMQQPGSPRALTRPQMEVLASRTSFLNECFY
jgi:hypothetical protein